MRTQLRGHVSGHSSIQWGQMSNLKFYDFPYVFRKPDLNHATVGNLNRSTVQSNRPNMPGCTALGH